MDSKLDNIRSIVIEYAKASQEITARYDAVADGKSEWVKAVEARHVAADIAELASKAMLDIGKVLAQ